MRDPTRLALLRDDPLGSNAVEMGVVDPEPEAQGGAAGTVLPPAGGIVASPW